MTSANMSGGAARPAVDVGDAEALIDSIAIGTKFMLPGKRAVLDALRCARSKLDSKPLPGVMNQYKYNAKTIDFEASFTLEFNTTEKGQCDILNLDKCFSSARVAELIENAMIRMLCFYFQTHRTVTNWESPPLS